MPYVLLVIGLLIGAIALYRFMLRASRYQIRALILTLLTLGVAGSAVFLAITGRLPAAVAILMTLWPLGIAWMRNRRNRQNLPESQQDKDDQAP